jgi:molybdopterin molybdotransferase
VTTAHRHQAVGSRLSEEWSEPAGPVPWAAARIAAYAAPDPLPPDTVPLADALGTTLAAPLVAAASLPAFDCAAMDGYAVGSATGPWRIVGRVLAGHGIPSPLGAGEAVEIATGAPTPTGAVGVLPHEQATVLGGAVHGEAVPGRHLRPAGEDAVAGRQLLPAGTPVNATILGLAAAVGGDVLAVRPRPRVAALLTGDELIYRGLPGDGRVRDAVGPALPGLVQWLGGEPVLVLPVPDTPANQLAAAVDAADGEVIVTVGGAAHGPADRLCGTLRRLGARTIVPSVACRPGHPQRLALLPDGRWLVGLPGNPYAALVASVTLLGPLVAGLTGRPLPVPPTATFAPPSQAAHTAPGAHDFARIVPVQHTSAGRVEPVGHDRPGSLWGAALADALAVVPAGWAGEPVPLVALPPA